MNELSDKLLQEVLSLPSNLRTILIDKLIESLNIPTHKEIDDLWAEEAEQRVSDINSGKVKFIPGEKVFKEVRKEINVIKTDVFARIRHPMYFGSILTYVCFIILSLSIVALVIFIAIVIFYYYLCRYEENLLIEKLGYFFEK